MRMIAMLTKCLKVEPRSQLSQESIKNKKIKKNLKTYKKTFQNKHFSFFKFSTISSFQNLTVEL